MALEEFDNEEQTENEKRYRLRRSIMDYGMGILWLAMGIFFLFIDKFNPDLARNYDPVLIRIFGTVTIVYGLFRIYRGYQKNYFRK